MERFDVTVIGAGPAGLAAALSAAETGARVLLVEREALIGGILKQCIHDGFGLLRFGERLSGPEYAARFSDRLPGSGVDVRTLAFVTRIVPKEPGYALSLVSRDGFAQILTGSVVFATGCRERTSRQIGVHGRHCAGVLTAGAAQYYTNILGRLPTKRCVILGSGDIGLIMARRLTLEGAEVVGVYEAKPTPSGLTRNISQCLDDFCIPLYTSRTVTRVFGEERVEAVEISDVDAQMQPIDGTQTRVDCDALILSVGLIPENELAETLGVPIDRRTKGPIVDQSLQTLLCGAYCCGNALHVNDLVDYVSESGACAGHHAALHAQGHQDVTSRALANVCADHTLLTLVPQRIDCNALAVPVPFYFRVAEDRDACRLCITVNGKPIHQQRYACLRPPEMQRVELDLSSTGLRPGDTLTFTITEVPS